MLWNGDIIVKFPWYSGEILVKRVKQQETHTKKHNSAFPQVTAGEV